jgi:hypothetical protein
MSDAVVIGFVSFPLEQWFMLAIYGLAGNTGNKFRNSNKTFLDLG